MKEQLIPVFYDTGSSAATQYREAIQGIRTAAHLAGEKIQRVSEKEAESFSYASAPPVSRKRLSVSVSNSFFALLSLFTE